MKAPAPLSTDAKKAAPDNLGRLRFVSFLLRQLQPPDRRREGIGDRGEAAALEVWIDRWHVPCRDLYGGFSHGKARSYWQYLAIMEKGHGLRMPACTGKSSPLTVHSGTEIPFLTASIAAVLCSRSLHSICRGKGCAQTKAELRNVRWQPR